MERNDDYAVIDSNQSGEMKKKNSLTLTPRFHMTSQVLKRSVTFAPTAFDRTHALTQFIVIT